MKLYRFYYSPYARKVQMLLDLLGDEYELIDVTYGERNELAELTGGYIYVPVFVDRDGTVVVESRDICERILSRPDAAWLVPSPLEGPIWAYEDFANGSLEDVLFRLASPGVREKFPTPSERALYNLVKERKFGAGCITAWQRDREGLLTRARKLVAPTLRTLERLPFVFGAQPSFADVTLYGQWMMLEAAEPQLLSLVSPALVEHARRLEAFVATNVKRPAKPAH